MATKPSGPISAKLFHAIMMVESGGDVDAVGDKGKSIGAYQIQESYWRDATDFKTELTANGETWQDCKGTGSLTYSEKVMQAYMERYATKSRLGHDPKDEDLARIHNGGPNGYKNPNTVQYWVKVKKYL